MQEDKKEKLEYEILKKLNSKLKEFRKEEIEEKNEE